MGAAVTAADVGAVLVAVLHISSALCLLFVAVPQSVAMFKGRIHGWQYQDFRLMTVSSGAATSLILVWRAAVYIDWGLFDQRFFGAISNRWVWELFIIGCAQIAYGYAARLYRRYRKNYDEPTQANVRKRVENGLGSKEAP